MHLIPSKNWRRCTCTNPTFAGGTNGGRGEDFETATATVTATEIEETILNVSLGKPKSNNYRTQYRNP